MPSMELLGLIEYRQHLGEIISSSWLSDDATVAKVPFANRSQHSQPFGCKFQTLLSWNELELSQFGSNFQENLRGASRREAFRGGGTTDVHIHVVSSVDVGEVLKSQVSERNRRMVMGTLAEKQASLQRCLIRFLGTYKVQVCGFDSALNSVILKIVCKNVPGRSW